MDHVVQDGQDEQGFRIQGVGDMVQKRFSPDGSGRCGYSGSTIGSDRLEQYMSRSYDDRMRKEDELEAAMQKLIDQAQCRLLERATGGRLTWRGDQIVRVPRRSGRYEPQARGDQCQAQAGMSRITRPAEAASGQAMSCEGLAMVV